MTESTPTEGQQPVHPSQNPNSILYARPITPPQPGSMLYAPPLTAERMRELRENRERQDREHRERQEKIDQAWRSPEAQKIRELVLDDGNVDGWREFVSFAGGILAVVAMVDEHGRPDPGQIVPKIDELFYSYVQKEIDAGSVFRRKPRNRPYQPGPDVVVARRGQFPVDVEPSAPEGNPFQPTPRSHRR